MGIYTEYWTDFIGKLLKEITPSNSYESATDALPVLQLGNRESDMAKGRVVYWMGRIEECTNSAVFRNLSTVLNERQRLYQIVPGLLEIKITPQSTITVNYQPATYEILIKRYKALRYTPLVEGELYKWELIKKFQDEWKNYENGKVTFREFWNSIRFDNLLFPYSVSVFNHMCRENIDKLEELINVLYDETKPLRDRVFAYKKQFEDAYYQFHDAGKNSYQDDRTIATLLTFRYPDKYTLFKDSFYVRLCHANNIKYAAPGEKIFHYYRMVNDFRDNFLLKDTELLSWHKERLNPDKYYKDENGYILAQDVLYLTIDKKQLSDEIINTLLSFKDTESVVYFFDLISALIDVNNMTENDKRLRLSIEPTGDKPINITAFIGKRGGRALQIFLKNDECHFRWILDKNDVPDNNSYYEINPFEANTELVNVSVPFTVCRKDLLDEKWLQACNKYLNI